ncbi:MAG: trigger factor [Oscillospiraceae bacterium]|nr:trigger factor [Oscillospiraceae bacterium]
MIIKSTEKNTNKATIVVEIESDLMNKGAEIAYKKQRKNIRLPGFRPGKAPRKMIENMYGKFVFFEDAIEELFPEIYDFAIGGNAEFKAVGRPSLENMDIADDGTTTLTLSTEVYPEVTLGEYKGIEVAKAVAEVTDEQVEAELKQIAENVASIENVERAAELGDIANINFLGTVDGIAFEGGAAENFDLTLGSGQFIPGFEEQVVGMNVGESKDVNVTFPADYNAKELAGKAAVFAVKLNKLSVKNVPAIDDELAKDASEFETLEELKADIREKKLADAQKNIDRTFENAVVEAVAAAATVEVPSALVDLELDNQMNDFAYRLQMSGMKVEDYAKMMGGDLNTMRQAFKPMAEKQALSKLVIAKVAEVENITVSDEELEAEFAEMAKAYELEIEKIKEMVPTEEIKENLASRKTVKFLVENAVAKAE